MSLLVVGSIALDTVETPQGTLRDGLGGSAIYFSYAASFFTDVSLVGVVGEDFPGEHREMLETIGVDTAGLQVLPGKTFRWHGRYEGDMNVAETISTDLNVFGEFDPQLPSAYAACPYVFLANGVPVLQQKVLEQAVGRRFTVADTMNLWIDTAQEDLWRVLGQVDALVLNDQEARSLTGEDNLVRAGRRILEAGPRYCIIKKGEHGAMLVSAEETFALPAYPVDTVVDPTGAGDSFAGGLMGYLAQVDRVEPIDLKCGMAYGTVVASFNVEDFSLNRFKRTTRAEIDARLDGYRRMLEF